MKLKNIFFTLLIIGIMAISIATVSAGQQVTINETDFVLDDSITITGEQDNFVNFYLEKGITGFLSNIVSEDDKNSYIENDTELDYYVMELDTSADGEVKKYAFIDSDISKGYFTLFEKNGKEFIFCVQTDPSTENFNKMADLLNKFINENKDLKPIT